jgi:type IV secretion system protein TrbI
VTENFGTWSPEHFELRTKPRAIRRINGRALVFGCAALALVIGGTTIVAFSPARGLRSGGQRELYNTNRLQTAEGLEKLPKSYSDLEPRPNPLSSAEMGARSLPNVDPSNSSLMATEEEEAGRAERSRQARLALQAKESGLFVRLSEKNDRRSQAAGLSQTGPAQSTAIGSVSADDREALPQSAAQSRNVSGSGGASDGGGETISSSQAHKLSFAAAKAGKDTTNSHDLATASSPYTLMAGSLLAASLVTGVNSDLPGLVIAQITENVFDTVTGEYLLIPQGSRLMGKYDSVIAFGQKRALIVWNRIILPNGDSVIIENLPAADAAGYTGLEDEVDLHGWQLLKGIGLATLFGVGSQLTLGNNNDALVQALRQSVQTNTNQGGQRMVERELDVQPTITVRPGWPLRVIVAKDLVMRPYGDPRS